MDAVLFTVIITFFVTLLICGGLFYWFGGSLNFFGTQGFHGKFEYFLEGVILGAIFVAPLITTIVLLIRKFYRSAIAGGVITVLVWFIALVIVPYIVDKRQAALDSAPAMEIAKRAVEREDKEWKGQEPDPSKYARGVGNKLWIYEGTATRLEAAKEKETVEFAAEMIVNNETIDPAFSSYAWGTRYNGSEVYCYEMVLFFEDGTYVGIYTMEPERWRELGLADPPGLDVEKRRD